MAKLVEILRQDRGVIVQEAASAALTAHAAHAKQALPALLEAFDPDKQSVRPGRMRTNSILTALAALEAHANAGQKQQMLQLAVSKLSFAPGGSLRVLRSLGPEARQAVPQVTAYRRTANRFQCNYIDRHVLPAIEPMVAASTQ